MKDGLKRTNFRVDNLYAYKGISGVSATFTGSVVSDVTGNVTGDVTGGINQSFTSTSGTVINDIPAEAVISGGMFVIGSAGSATTPSYVCKPAPANTGQPLGICLTTTASGANPNILVQGLYQGVVAEASLNNGVGFSMGAGAALNCIKAAAAGTTRGTVVMGGGSEASVSVYLW